MKLGMPCMNKTLIRSIAFPILVEEYRWEFTKARAEFWKINWVDLNRLLTGSLRNFLIILVILDVRTVILFISQSIRLKMVL